MASDPDVASDGNDVLLPITNLAGAATVADVRDDTMFEDVKQVAPQPIGKATTEEGDNDIPDNSVPVDDALMKENGDHGPSAGDALAIVPDNGDTLPNPADTENPVAPDEGAHSLEGAADDDAPPEISGEGERSVNQDDSIVTEDIAPQPAIVHGSDPAMSEHHESTVELQHSDDNVLRPSGAGAENEDASVLAVDTPSGDIQQPKDDVDPEAHDPELEARASGPTAGDVIPEVVEQTLDNRAALGSLQQGIQEDTGEAIEAQPISTLVVHDERSTLVVEDSDVLVEEATPAVAMAVQPQEPVEPTIELAITNETVAPDVQMDTQDVDVLEVVEADVIEERAEVNEQVVEQEDEIVAVDDDAPNFEGETPNMTDQDPADNIVSRSEIDEAPMESTEVLILEATNFASGTPMPGVEESTVVDDEVVVEAEAEGPVTHEVITDDVQMETPDVDFNAGQDDDALISQGATEDVVTSEPGFPRDDVVLDVPASAGEPVSDKKDAFPSPHGEVALEMAPEMGSSSTEQELPSIAPDVVTEFSAVNDESVHSLPDGEPESLATTLDDSGVDPSVISVLPLESTEDVPETILPVLPEALVVGEQSSITEARILELETTTDTRGVTENDEYLAIGPIVDVSPAVDHMVTEREEAETTTRGVVSDLEDPVATQEISVMDTDKAVPEVEQQSGIPALGTTSFITEQETTPADLNDPEVSTAEDRPQLSNDDLIEVADPSSIEESPADGAVENTDVVGLENSVGASSVVAAVIPDYQREVIETEVQVSSDETFLTPAPPAIASAVALGSQPYDHDAASIAAAAPVGIQPDNADVARDSDDHIPVTGIVAVQEDEPAGAGTVTAREIPFDAAQDVEAELPVETEDGTSEAGIRQSETSVIAELEDTVGVPQVLQDNKDESGEKEDASPYVVATNVSQANQDAVHQEDPVLADNDGERSQPSLETSITSGESTNIANVDIAKEKPLDDLPVFAEVTSSILQEDTTDDSDDNHTEVTGSGIQEMIDETEITQAVEVVDAETEHSKSPWVASDDMVTQGDKAPDVNIDVSEFANLPVNAVSNTIVVQSLPSDIERETPVDGEPLSEAIKPVTTPVIHVSIHSTDPDGASQVLQDSVLHPADEVVDVHPDVERPRSPWTPSYGVTTQGPEMSGVAAEDEIILEQLPPLASAEPVIRPLAEEPTTSSEFLVETNPQENVVLMDDNSTEVGGTHPASQALEILSTEFVVPSDADRPPSPWNPSYSVTTQGLESPGPLNENEPTTLSELSLPSSQVEAIVTDLTNNSDQRITTDVGATDESNLIDSNLVEKTIEPETLSITADVEEERPKSPWTPSYGVTRQGSGVSEHGANEDEDAANATRVPPEPDVSPSVLVVPGRHEDLIVSADPEVSQAESSAEQAVIGLSFGALENLPIPDQCIDVVREDPSTLLLAVHEEQKVERPHSPSSSYSVTRQGSGFLDAKRPNEESPQLEQLSDAVLVDEPEDQDSGHDSGVVAEIQPLAETASDPPSQEPSSDRGQDVALHLDNEDPSPHIPIDSVADIMPKDTVPSAEETMLTVTENPALQEPLLPSSEHITFPGTLDELGKPARPAALRLAPVKEDDKADNRPLRLDLPSPTTTRKRLESTTSSLFFPGGWFSPTKPQGRTSMEIAQGEFTASKSPIEVTPPPPTPTTGFEAPEKKGKSCIIM